MNKELKYSDGSVSYVEELEKKVRQQQAEIEVLKQILSYEGIEVALDECVEEFRKAQEK